MENKRPYNKRLTELLIQYPDVFIKDETISKSKKMVEIEDKIIDNLKNYVKEKAKKNKKIDIDDKNNIIVKRENKDKIRVIININKNQFPNTKNLFSVGTYLKFIKACFKNTSDDHPYFSEAIAAIIILKMLDEGKNIIELPPSNVDKKEATFELKEENINDIVKKLTAWLIGENSVKFIESFPQTTLASLFISENGKISLNGFSFSLKNTSFNCVEKLEQFLSSDDGKKFLLPLLLKAIKEQTKHYLILGYLWKHSQNPIKRLRDFIKKNCIIIISTKEKKIGDEIYTVKLHCNAPVISVIRNLKDLLKELSVNSAYTYVDFLHFLGYISCFAENENHYQMLVDNKFYSCIEKELHIDTHSIETMLLKATKENILTKKTESDKTWYKFSHKDYRLIFEGMILAWSYNTMRINHKEVADLILNVHFKGDSPITETNHLNLNFNRSVVRNISLLYFSDNREFILDELCNIANDFSAANRRRQTNALYLLSDYLIDGLPVSSVLRKKIWLSTFGTSMYPFMWQKIWPLLTQIPITRTSDSSYHIYFLDYIKETFKSSCVFNDEKKYAEGDAYFIFWMCTFNKYKRESNDAKLFLSTSLKCFNDFWQRYLSVLSLSEEKQKKELQKSIHELFSEIKIEDIINLLSTAIIKMEEHLDKEKNLRTESPDILYYINGVQLLLYILADFESFCKKGNDVLAKIKEKNFSSALIKCLILCDYLTRKYNRKYNNQEFKSMFILCGPFRLICAYYFSGEKYEMLEEMITDYTRWIENEQEIRYKALLYRLLSYTTYPIENLRSNLAGILNNVEEDYKQKLKAPFLSYDNMILNKELLDNPHHLYKTTDSKD